VNIQNTGKLHWQEQQFKPKAYQATYLARTILNYEILPRKVLWA